MTTTSADIATKPFHELAAVLRGELIVPGDPGYEQARAVYNGMIDKHPAAIARCRDTADVIACVRFAREHGAEIAVRGGRIKASYRGNYHRLAQIKDRYDPGNTFHINQNIQPASELRP